MSAELLTLEKPISKFWQHYDTIYASKDYDHEVEVILPFIGHANTLLEIGCGTGEHTKRLAPHFQGLCAIDMDYDAIQIARTKKKPYSVLIHTALEDFRGTDFGAAVALFNVVHSCPTRYWLDRFMRGVAGRLQPGGTFVFDCWSADRVLTDLPRAETRITSNLAVIELDPKVNVEARTVRVNMDVRVDDDHFHTHVDHRLWTIQEYTEALQAAGFDEINVVRWMQPVVVATEMDWKIMFICEKRK